MERIAIISIIGIVIISVLAVVYVNSSTGAYSSAVYGYGSKLYGPGLKKAQADNPYAFGKAYGKAVMDQRYQAYMYANEDTWDCSFDTSDGNDPCIYDDAKQKWCCLSMQGFRS